MVNVIAPIMTKKGGPAIRQTIYYPYLLLSQYGRGEAIRAVVDAPMHETKFGDAPQVYTSLIWNEEKRQLTVFAINIDEQQDAPGRSGAGGL